MGSTGDMGSMEEGHTWFSVAVLRKKTKELCLRTHGEKNRSAGSLSSFLAGMVCGVAWGICYSWRLGYFEEYRGIHLPREEHLSIRN